MRLRASSNGSTLIMVIIMTSVLSVTAASLLQFGMTERRMNKSSILFTEARNGAESMVEYGSAELKSRWLKQSVFNADELRDSPISIPPTASDFFTWSRIDYDALELVGGAVSAGEWKYIDPELPENLNDPQKGKMVFKRDVTIYGKATATDATLGSKTAYCEQVLSIRDAPLFSHAIFYNMDLEFHPGPAMNMQGPVHSNGNTYLQAIDRLRFYSGLMTAGDLIYGYKLTGGITQTGTVEVQNAEGEWISFYKGGGKSSASSYYQSSEENWREDATNRWGGYVGSREHSVPKLNPLGIDDYIPDDPGTVANEKYNPAFALIEPLVETAHDNYKGDAIRDQQFAYKAGLVIKVTANGSGYDLSAYKYKRTDNQNPKSPPQMDIDGNPETVDLDLDRVEQVTGQPLVDVQLYNEDGSGNPVSGLYDRRQEQNIDIIELDVGLLAQIINDGENLGGNEDPWNGSYKLNPGSAVDWNGVVYVELPYDSSTSARDDKVMPAHREVALRLVNGESVPNPDFAKASGNDAGFTLATNGQLYIKGHFNADGDSATGSSTETDDGETLGSTEAPVSVWADSITILSSAFDDTKTKLSPSNRRAEFTEVSAALVTGLLPTISGTSQMSGGAHNLPRFLEKWSNVEFRYRGSLVALYESESGTAPMTSSHSAWYSPPTRNWGFNSLFGAGVYPPGTPNTRDFRRSGFRYLTAAEYASGLSSLNGFSASASALGHGSSFCSPGEEEADSGNDNGNGNGNGNNGHGNNEDGVDSSNPGNSKQGEDSDPSVDDESSNGNGSNGNSNGNGNANGKN